MPAAAVWSGVGQAPGLRVWRVKEFQPIEEPKQDHGYFFSGDCYLVLETFRTDTSLRHHIHFWLGKDATQDEAGSVAIFAAQLDEALGGGPLQFRQPQGYESAEFLRLFPRIKYLAGGYASGFRDASAGRGKGPVRLYQIKSPNKACVQVFEVPCSLASLNHGDCFLLEDVGGRLLWVWHGSGANIREKMRAVEAANAFKEGTGIKLSVLDDGDFVSTEALEFFRRLGCQEHPDPGAIRDAQQADKPSPRLAQPPRLFRVLDGGRNYDQVCTDGTPLHASLLQPAGQFVLLAAGAVWVWTGAECGGGAAPPLQVGAAFAAQQGLPPDCVVKAVKARFEPGIFATHFAGWGAAGGATTEFARAGRDSFGNRIPGVPGRGTDDLPYNADEAAAAMASLAAEAGGGGGKAEGRAAVLEAAYGRLTSSKIQVWVMTGASSLELPRQEVGHFYDGAAYIVLHSYSTSSDGSDVRHAVYSWQGRLCGPLEAGAAAVMAADLHRSKYAGRSSLVRVEQNLEPGHFVRLFKGAMIVRSGPRPSNLAPGRSPPGTHLYQVKGEAVAMAHAVEVPAAAASLCSGDCFVLEVAAEVGAPAGSAEPVRLWLGGGSSAAEREVAAAVAGALAAGGGAVEAVEEGSEPEAFWAALGGRAPYPSSSARAAPAAPPRLFHLRDCAGRGLKVELHTSFSRDSLAGDDCMLLDTGAELYVWYGGSCKPHERPRARDVAHRFLAASGRQGRCPLVEVEAGHEPHFFTCHFPGWGAATEAQAERLQGVSLGKAGA